MDTSHPKVKNDASQFGFAADSRGFKRGMSHMELNYFAAEKDGSPYRLVVTSRPHMFIEPLSKIERAIRQSDNEDITSYEANHVRHYLKPGTLTIWAKNTDCLFDLLKDARVLNDDELEQVRTHYSVLLSENMQNTVAANTKPEDASEAPKIHKPKNGQDAFIDIEYALPEDNPPGLEEEFEVTLRFDATIDSQAADMLFRRIEHRIETKAGWGRELSDDTQGNERSLTVKTRYPERIVEDLQRMNCIKVERSNEIYKALHEQRQSQLPEGVVRLSN